MRNQSDFIRNDTWTHTDSVYILISECTSFLSIAGCLTIIALYWGFKELRTTSRLLLVFLSVADILVAASTLFQTEVYSISQALPDQFSMACQMSSGLWVLSQVCAALWTSAVITYLFLCVTLRWVSIANRIVFLFHVFCWGMPIVVSVAADLSRVYGYNMADILVQRHPTWCWISGRVGNALPWYFITVEGWVLASFCLICLLYVPITVSIIRGRNKGKVMSEDDVIEELAKETANEQLRYIPVIYVCTRIWGCAHFLFTRYPADANLRSSDWLMLFRAFGDNSQGLINAIYFCLATKQIRKIIASRLTCCCICFAGCCRRTRNFGRRTWMRVPSNIVKMQHRKPSRTRALDGSDLDISGISLDLPSPDDGRIEEDEVIFEK